VFFTSLTSTSVRYRGRGSHVIGLSLSGSSIVSVEETSTRVELAFTAALEDEGLFAAVEARTVGGLADPTVDDESARSCSPCPTTDRR